MPNSPILEAAARLGRLTGGLLDRTPEVGLDRVYAAATGRADTVPVFTPEQLADAELLVVALDYPSGTVEEGDEVQNTGGGLAALEAFRTGFAEVSPLPEISVAELEARTMKAARRELFGSAV